jgi:hypothetical protein
MTMPEPTRRHPDRLSSLGRMRRGSSSDFAPVEDSRSLPWGSCRPPDAAFRVSATARVATPRAPVPRRAPHGRGPGDVRDAMFLPARGPFPGARPLRLSPRRRRRLRRTLVIAVAVLAGIAVCGGLVVFGHLDANLRSSSLFAGVNGNAGTEKADSFGRLPINILLIGSDTRAGVADCRFGGDRVIDFAGVIDKGSSPRTTYTTAAEAAATSLRYGPGLRIAARAVADSLGLPADRLTAGSVSGIILVIGTDWPAGTTFPASTAPVAPSADSAPAVDTAAALRQAHVETADQSGSCAVAGTQKTVMLEGIAMTPGQAFRRSTEVPVSAP